MFDTSRRSFLKALVASAISVGLDPFAGIEVASDFYQNRRLGLSFLKPSGWEFDSIADFVTLRERQVLLNESPDEVHTLKDPESLPTVVIADVKHQRGDFAPGIMLWDEPLPPPSPSSAAAEIYSHRRMIRGFAQCYKEVQTIREPEALSLDGVRATQAAWSYKHEVDDGQAGTLQIRSLLVFRPARVHTFYLIVPDGFDCVAPSTFDRFIRTIKYQ